MRQKISCQPAGMKRVVSTLSPPMQRTMRSMGWNDGMARILTVSAPPGVEAGMAGAAQPIRMVPDCDDFFIRRKECSCLNANDLHFKLLQPLSLCQRQCSGPNLEDPISNRLAPFHMIDEFFGCPMEGSIFLRMIMTSQVKASSRMGIDFTLENLISSETKSTEIPMPLFKLLIL